MITYVQTTPKETNRASLVPSHCQPTQNFGESRSPQNFAARGMALQNHGNAFKRSNRCLQRQPPEHHARQENLDGEHGNLLPSWFPKLFEIRTTKISKIFDWPLRNRRYWRVPNPPGANPLVAETAPWRSPQSRVTRGQQPFGNE